MSRVNRSCVKVEHRGPRVLLLGPARSAVSGVPRTSINCSNRRCPVASASSSSRSAAKGARRADGYAIPLLTDPFALTVCLIRCRPRIVHINTSLEPRSYWRDIVFLALAKTMKRAVVYQVHGGALPGEFFASNRVLTALLRRVLSWPDAVVLLARSEMAAYSSFAPRARLLRIANAVSADEADLRAERYNTNRPLRIVYLGRLAADKGIFETIEAVKILRDRGIAVSLTIAGSGPARGEITQAIEADRLGDSACLVEPLFGPAKQQLWREADVLAFPTYHREGLPYALLEAMASGAVPVISSVGAIPDVVQDEVHGLFVPAHEPRAVADALERLANDRPLLHQLALAARARVVEHYSVARMTRNSKRFT